MAWTMSIGGLAAVVGRHLLCGGGHPEESMAGHERTGRSEQLLQRSEIHGQWEFDYLNPDMDRFYDLAFSDILKRLRLSPSDRLLDAGCGYCYHTLRLARGCAQITAVDFSDAALAVARRTIAEAGADKRIEVQKADLTCLSFEDASFDAVVSWGVIMHIPDVERALSELARVLKPGGTLVLCENNMSSLDVAVRERAINGIKRLLRLDRPEVKHTPRGIEVWMESELGGGLLVRKTSVRFLTKVLRELGLNSDRAHSWDNSRKHIRTCPQRRSSALYTR